MVLECKTILVESSNQLKGKKITFTTHVHRVTLKKKDMRISSVNHDQYSKYSAFMKNDIFTRNARLPEKQKASLTSHWSVPVSWNEMREKCGLVASTCEGKGSKRKTLKREVARLLHILTNKCLLPVDNSR